MSGTLGWGAPLALVALAIALVALASLAHRRRVANRALHELRRPLQALALGLAGPGPSPRADGRLASQLTLAAVALADLDRAVNGGSGRPSHRLLRCESLLEEAGARWRPVLAATGGEIRTACRASGWVLGDAARLGQAIDNLVANALEHGGGSISIECSTGSGRVRIAVRDGGRSPRRAAVGVRRLPAIASRGKRRGQGLGIVTRTARAHGGRFLIGPSGEGVAALLELPLAETDGAAAAA